MKKTAYLFLIIICIILFSFILIYKPEISLLNNNKTNMQQTGGMSIEPQGIILEANGLMEEEKGDKYEDQNTAYLQSIIDEAATYGSATVILPEGTYYFGIGGVRFYGECYAIKCRSNVTLIGAGTEEEHNTTLIPIADTVALEGAGLTAGSMDMFYFNDYAENTGNSTPEEDFPTIAEESYLENANYKDFIIDGSQVAHLSYNSSGKGFMVNLFRNCNWENVVVNNTVATGFGMDCPVNCTIINCKADNCGRAVTKVTDMGGSGFGIGTGYSNDESIYIYNCASINCGKYGYFFEHQAKFKNNHYMYPAQESKGFVVSNCVASGNRYDFGGERAYDVTYENCSSHISNSSENYDETKNITAIHFQEHSIRCHVVNCTVEKEFNDVTSGSFYYNAMNWGLKNGIMEANSTGWNVDPNHEMTRGEAILLLHRTESIQMDYISYGRLDEVLDEQIITGFSDVLGSNVYSNAIKWAKDNGIVFGNSSSCFNPDSLCTRKQFIIMLYRYAGSPEVEPEELYVDISGKEAKKAVTWAKYAGITNGTSPTEFSPDATCTKAMIITWLYRLENAGLEKSYQIRYNLLGGTLDTPNPTTYIAGESEFTLNNPTRRGYVFNGWTGSTINVEGYTGANYTPEDEVSITTSDRGNKVYSANWTPISYIVQFDPNDGVGQMDDEYFTYDRLQSISSNSFTKLCHEFIGWNTAPDGSGIGFLDEETIDGDELLDSILLAENNTITLYAQWEEGEHDYTSVTVAPTCVDEGSITYTCQICGKEYVEEIPASGHTPDNIVITVPATCTENRRNDI